MKLSARARYAARILLELARNAPKNEPLSASTLSYQTGVSVQFVEQILKPLKQKGLTMSVRGAAGGHKLAKPASDISLGEVVRIMEDGIQLTVCCGEKANSCPRKSGCLTRKAWLHVSRTLEQELDAISIERLLHEDAICLNDNDPPAKAKRSAARAIPAVQSAPKRVPAKTGLRKVKGLARAAR
ncbi:RrF2 family transcriptional regulator [Desulfovibrio cuneatus]|uniref:RrF2 family transcriptional regulator n=1 Tax=Desulfovibrio cuneatus TaxID=159728 RepID=UPI000412AF26|nr:Rrf2 family transcriptional regulator [Desulfovibrio cuneatus]